MLFLYGLIIFRMIECRGVSADAYLEQSHGCLENSQTILLERCSLEKQAVEQGGQLVQRVLPRTVQPARTRKRGSLLAETGSEAHSSKTNSGTEKMSRAGRKAKLRKRLEEENLDEELEPFEEVEHKKRRTKHIIGERSTFYGASEGEEEGDGAEKEGLQFVEEDKTWRNKRRAARHSAQQRKNVRGSHGQPSMIVAEIVRFLATPFGIVIFLVSAFACVQLVLKRKQLERVWNQLKGAQSHLTENHARESAFAESLGSAYKTNEVSKQDMLPKAEAEKAKLMDRIEEEKAALKREIDNATQSATVRVAELETALGQLLLTNASIEKDPSPPGEAAPPSEVQAVPPRCSTTPRAVMEPMLASREPETSSAASPLSVVGASTAETAAPPVKTLPVVALASIATQTSPEVCAATPPVSTAALVSIATQTHQKFVQLQRRQYQ